ncbi:hypothetical protein BDW59DRAFT_139805 [Aspergillus cavernicola]|uniref:Uncharacterized protein n=1 Tax=Aspergillus cavernicola TaxID=176166 RepID=A0ABR4IWK7_9EURO
MAVNALPEPPSLGPPSNSPSMNKRLPPLADKASLSYRLTNLSKQKLAREATAPDPDIRRCLTHFRLHVRSIELAQQEVATKITSFEFEDDESEEEEARQEELEERQGPTPVPTSVEPAIQAQTEMLSTPSDEAEQTMQAHLDAVTSLSDDENEKDAGIVDKGRRCLEKAQKPFWPSPAQCIPVRIAG